MIGSGVKSSLARWWVRVPLYVVAATVVSRIAYRVAYLQQLGPHPDESEREFSSLAGIAWGGTTFVVLLSAGVLVELVMVLRRLEQ